MTKSNVRAVQADPGGFVFYSLDYLIRPAKKRNVNFAEWGVCESGNLYWLGEQSFVEGKETFKLSLLEVLEKRNEEYPDWGNEEVYVLVGLDGSGKFYWFLLNKEEYQAQKGMPLLQ